ncbi:DUF1542 domain-containing protein [Gordonia sp. CPCC 205333]|uniref:DUF1542 domain-containing protein n=1 Tax=Gordonia sp. CPCC 205333 TaxID=3140790 RepID=UPI003AF40A3B
MKVLLILILVLIVGAAIVWWLRTSQARTQQELADAAADARQVIERLGGQVYSLTGTDAASRQALADAAERHNAAGGAISSASTPAQARLAKQTALEGLYYVRAARAAMGIDPGPPIAELDGQRAAGVVTEKRSVDHDGHELTASPDPSTQTPNYYPGGRVAGRSVPAGWYSEPWWRPALIGGAWGVGSALLFGSLFSGMSGVDPSISAGDDFGNGLYDGDQGSGGDDSSGFDGGGFDGGGFDGGGF